MRTSVGISRTRRFSAQRCYLLRTIATLSVVTSYGIKYIFYESVTSPTGKETPVLSVWQVDDGASIPRLITAYPTWNP